MDYLQYCRYILLTEETMQDVLNRLKAEFPNESEQNVYKQILDLYPSIQGKAIILGILVRTNIERKKLNVTPQQTLNSFKAMLEFKNKFGLTVDFAGITKRDKAVHPNNEDSNTWQEVEADFHRKQIIQKDREIKKAQKKSIKIGGADDDEEKMDTMFPNPAPNGVTKDVEIYFANSPGQCASMINEPASVCTQRAGNFFGYRYSRKSTFYLVFARTEEVKKKWKWLQIEIRADGTWIVVDRGNREYDGGRTSLQDLITKPFRTADGTTIQGFPELVEPAKNGVFRAIPPTAEEIKIAQLVQNQVTTQTFSGFNYQLKTIYVSMGHKLDDRQWDMLDRDQKNDYINLRLNDDLTPHQLESIKETEQLYNRYLKIKERSVINKVQSGVFTKDGFTPHEGLVLHKILTSAKPEIKSAITKGLISSIKSIFSGTTPKEDLTNIYNIVKDQLLTDPSIKDPTFMKNVADILAGSKTNAWINISAEVKASIYTIANDIYSLNKGAMDALIMDKIKREPDTLLKGLITQPTPFQARYFNENEKQLLSNINFKEKLDESLSNFLIAGTELPSWLKGFWQTHKNIYFKDPTFKKVAANGFRDTIFGSGPKIIEDIQGTNPETIELYQQIMPVIMGDKAALLQKVKETMFESVMGFEMDKEGQSPKPRPTDVSGKSVDDVEKWDVSKDFKHFYRQHEEELKTWFTSALINKEPQTLREDLSKLIQNYKTRVYGNPTYRDSIEKKLIFDIVDDDDATYRWTGERFVYWMSNFWDIIQRNPGSEERMLARVIKEYTTTGAANGLYTEYAVPLSFYQKHKDKILAIPKARANLRQKIIDTMIWREDNLPLPQSIELNLSPIEKDYYNTHKNEFSEEDLKKQSG